jgi:signal transduction histidine kinase
MRSVRVAPPSAPGPGDGPGAAAPRTAAAPSGGPPAVFPARARHYLWLVVAAGAVALGAALMATVGGGTGGAALPAGLVAAAVATLHFPAALGPGRKSSLAVPVYFAGVLLLAPGPAVLVAGLGHGVGQATLALRRDPTTGRRRSTPRSAAFNTAQAVLATALGAVAFALLRPADGVVAAAAFAAAALAAGTMYLVNTWAVAVMVALQRGSRPLAVWQAARRRDLPEALGEYLLGLVGAWGLAQAPWLLALTVAGVAAAHGSLGRRAELARQEAELARQEAEAASLRELARLKDEFLSTVSHELRTPLTLVCGYAELLQARLQRPGPAAADPGAAGMAVRVGASAGQLARMVDDLLDFAYLERGALAVHPQDVDLVPVLRDAVAGFGRRPGAGRLTAELPAALPAHADPTRVVQVVTNLVANALKYAPEGPITLRAGPAPGDAAGAVRVEVQDGGPGIPLTEQPRVWEKFYRGAAVAGGATAGVGIGLAVVKAIVEAQDGQVGLDSAPGQGCRFWIDLPAPEAAAGGARRTA